MSGPALFRFNAVFVLISIICLFARPAYSQNDYPYVFKQVPVSGFVGKLVIPRSTPCLLYALVRSDGKPKQDRSYGVQVFDISDSTNPKPLAFLPVVSPVGFDITSDGRTLVLYSAYYDGFDVNAWYGVRVFDISQPGFFKEKGTFEIDILSARLSVDEKYVYVRERNVLQRDNNRAFSVIRIASYQAPERIGQLNEFALTLEMYPSADGKYLLAPGRDNELIFYDVADPSQPRKAYEKRHNLGRIAASRASGSALFVAWGEVSVAKLFPVLEKSGAAPVPLAATVADVDDDENAYLLSTDKVLHVVAFSNPALPKTTARYPMPSYIGGATKSRSDRFIYVGLLGSLAIVDPTLMQATAETLALGTCGGAQAVPSKGRGF